MITRSEMNICKNFQLNTISLHTICICISCCTADECEHFIVYVTTKQAKKSWCILLHEKSILILLLFTSPGVSQLQGDNGMGGGTNRGRPTHKGRVRWQEPLQGRQGRLHYNLEYTNPGKRSHTFWFNEKQWRAFKHICNLIFGQTDRQLRDKDNYNICVDVVLLQDARFPFSPSLDIFCWYHCVSVKL